MVVAQVTPAEDAQFWGFWAAHAGRPLLGRNKILASICPQLHGMFLAKLATALMLIGGVARQDEASGTCIRGQLHMLLVGDPGTGAPMPPACSLLSGQRKLHARRLCTGRFASTLCEG